MKQSSFLINSELSKFIIDFSAKYGHIVVLNNNSYMIAEELSNNDDAIIEINRQLTHITQTHEWEMLVQDRKVVYELQEEQLAKLQQIEELKITELEFNKSNEIKDELSQLISLACDRNATDIHMSITDEAYAEIYFRVNGVMDTTPMNKSREACISLIGGCIEWKGADGQSELKDFSEDVNNSTSIETMIYTSDNVSRKVDVRITYRSLTKKNKVAIFRIINSGSSIRKLSEYNLSNKTTSVLKNCINFSQGLVLLSGAVNSGKSSLLMSIVDGKPEDKVMHSIEDPIETKVRDRLCFQGLEHNAEKDLKDFMRYDLDIGMVAEMRTTEQAISALGLARTGRLILSTIHANDSLSIIDRLVDMGIDNSNLAERNLLRLLSAQRLVPVLCGCKRKITNDEFSSLIVDASNDKAEVLKDNVSSIFVRNHTGCKLCNGTGYINRSLIFEYVMVDDNGRKYIRNDDLIGWADYLKSNGWKTMADHAMHKIINGDVDPFVTGHIVPDLIIDASKAYKY